MVWLFCSLFFFFQHTALSNVGDVYVSVISSGLGHLWTVTFVGDSGDVSLMTANGAGLQGTSPVATVAERVKGGGPSRFRRALSRI